MLSLMATGSGLLFGGDVNGHFRAFDQKTGTVLWDIDLGAPVTGYPITFAVGGRQYVAASTGPSLVTAGLNALTPELQPANSSKLFVFALPGNSRCATFAPDGGDTRGYRARRNGVGVGGAGRRPCAAGRA